MSKEEAKDQLIQVLYSQVIDLTMMSKIELGDDVIAEIKRLKNIINEDSIYTSHAVPPHLFGTKENDTMGVNSLNINKKDE